MRFITLGFLLYAACLLGACSTEVTQSIDNPLHSGAKVTVTGSASPSSVSAGQTVTVTLSVTSTQSTALDVVLTVKNPSGQTGYTASWPGQAFQANVAQSFSEPIVVDATDPSGTYTVDVVVNRSGGQQLYHNASITTFTVAAGASDAGTGGTDAGTGGTTGSSCPSGALFCDDFTAASPPAPYVVQNGTWTRGSGTYTVADSVAWQRAGAFLSTGNYGDFDVTLKASSRGDSGLGLFYAASSTTAGYAVIVHPATYQGVYLKKLNGTAADTNIASYALPSNLAGQAFTLRVTRVGSSVTVFFNGTQVISADDGSGGATGQLGMLLSNTGTVSSAGAVFTFFELASAGTGTSTGTDAGTTTAPDAGTSTGTDAGTTTGGGSPMPVGVPGTWTLVFDDEFDGTSLDLTKWSPHWGSEGGVMNNVATYASNVSVSGGYLTLTLASSNSGALINTEDNRGFAVQVGMYAEARVSFPGNGSSLYNWPAWWISGVPWPSAGEHDIAEVLSGDLTVNYHSPSGAHNQGAVSGYWGDAFHTYGIYRKASSADVYWDGQLVKSYATDDNGSGEYLIFNVGAGGVGMYGTASQVKVDYVRVWQ